MAVELKISNTSFIKCFITKTSHPRSERALRGCLWNHFMRFWSDWDDFLWCIVTRDEWRGLPARDKVNQQKAAAFFSCWNQTVFIQFHWPENWCSHSPETIKVQSWHITCPEEPLCAEKRAMICLRTTLNLQSYQNTTEFVHFWCYYSMSMRGLTQHVQLLDRLWICI